MGREKCVASSADAVGPDAILVEVDFIYYYTKSAFIA